MTSSNTFRCDIQLSVADIQRYVFFAFRRASLQPGWRSGLYWSVLGVALCWPFFHAKDWWGLLLFGMGYAAIIAICWRQAAAGRWLFNQYGRPRRWMRWWVRRQVQQRCRQTDMAWYLQPWQVRISPLAIEAGNDTGSLLIPAEQLQVVETFDYFFCYHRTGGQFIILPKVQLVQAAAVSQLLQCYQLRQAA
ncbi:MAG: hypothetical protein MUF62_07605 [Chitinophagaceae bacterium]|jgi:hypothetical protein|nr:hypothetical protein [Chitinophagaceae bacterium]